MSLIRKIARPLLASSFIYDGVTRLRSPQGAEYLKPAVDAAAQARPELRSLKGQEKLVDQGLAAAQVVAGSLFAIGRMPRLSSTVLVVTGAVNAYVDFRSAEGPAKDAILNDGLKNLSLVGAVALTSVDTEGNPSLAWRANKLGHEVAKKSNQITEDVKKKSEDILGH